MEIVFHTGKESEKSLREFAEKRAEFLSRELQKFNAEELKALLSALKAKIAPLSRNEADFIIKKERAVCSRPGKEEF